MGNKKCSNCSYLMDASISVCPDCEGTTFDHNLPEILSKKILPSLPNRSKSSSSSKIDSPAQSKLDISKSDQQVVTTSLEFQALIKKQEETIRAIDRTTHAVRAFVLFLFYQLFALTVSGVLYVVGVALGATNEQCRNSPYGCSPNSFFVFLAIVTWIAGVIYSSNKGWEEIGKS